MTCRGFTQLLLKVINVLLTLVGLAMIGYGIYMVVAYESSSSTSPPPPPPPPSPPPPPPPSSPPPPSPPPPSPPPPSPPPPSPPPPPLSPPPPTDESYLQFRSPPSLNNEKDPVANDMGALRLRRVLLQKSSSFEFSSVSSIFSSLSTAWFLYVFIGVGVLVTLITVSGCVAASTVNGCCLSCYAFFVGLVIVVELSLAAFIFFYGNWEDMIPDDSTGELDSIENFIEDKFDILKWVALGIIIMQAAALFLAVILRALGSNARADYDSDDEYLAMRSNRQPLLNRQGATGPAGNSENHSTRADAWSTRMREKYGLDTKEFSYKPAESRWFWFCFQE
ncbi:hypothetical protein GOP47_0027425 [Adiantum capillus-veneris]|nr:hypothetical protein GOP47_0027425 [Adiantum capillus-veneris]